MKLPKLLTNIRVVILIICLFLAVISISPSTQEGVAIRAVEKDSAANLAGIESPAKNSRPLDYEVIEFVNGKRISNEEDYYDSIKDLEVNRSITIKTNEDSYILRVQALTETVETGNIVNKTITKIIEVNETINETTSLVQKEIEEIIEVNETVQRVLGVKDLGISVFDAPTNNIRKGLDLAGGVRVLLEPEEPVGTEVLETAISSLEQRLNAFGLNDVIIRQSSDLSGNEFILVEIAGLQKKEINDLISSQGKFEAKISNQTAFIGGEDISYVCRSADCSGIDPQSGCGQVQGTSEWACRFYFTIDMTPEAAQRQAGLTGQLDVITEGSQQYLSEPIELYLDDELVDSLNIGAGLKGRAETTIQISGSGSGQSREEAITNSLGEMIRLQTIIETGSLPVKLNVVKIDNLSPALGEEFLRSALLAGLVALLSVGVVVFVRYRSFKVSIPMLVTAFSELILLLGVSALFGTNLDLAAIAGIIIVIGTSVDHQIVIADEMLRGEQEVGGWKAKIKSAFAIIMTAYLTTTVAMIPLWFAGAGILKGFALTTIYGASIGVFISRPAYAVIVEHFLKK